MRRHLIPRVSGIVAERSEANSKSKTSDYPLRAESPITGPEIPPNLIIITSYTLLIVDQTLDENSNDTWSRQKLIRAVLYQ
jgi:hypothetical protein